MKVITARKNSHIDYVDVRKSEKLTMIAGQSRDQRDLPCNKKSRSN